MTFKYYIAAISAVFVFRFMRKWLAVDTLLYVINLIFLALIFFSAKKHFALLVAHSLVIYIQIRFLSRKNKATGILVAGIFTSLLPLMFFKYTIPKEFFLAIFPYAGALLKPASFIGLSFYTFKNISLLVDTYFERTTQRSSYWQYFIYATFFPCILSGPLDRYSRFQNDINTYVFTWDKDFESVYRIILGIFKKIVLADILWNFSNDSINQIDMAQIPTWKIILGQYAYAVMLYFDFSGYSDVAIGISRLFGVETPENFNLPWLARNVQEFWNSWHISFMHWLRDYIYYPIQTSLYRLGVTNISCIVIISYTFVFVVAGLWHGESIHFLQYGLFHAFGFMVYFIFKMVIDKKVSKNMRKLIFGSSYWRFFAITLTLNYFVVGLVFFINKGEIFSLIAKRIV